ncbi:hypothetical protein I3843_05G092900 [Carya illinoinensis]|uniref:Uncharacterized protein n=1 Tax=Carya illinoinensis TaxID=32201 RepID=A0A8T1QHF1_CARIL|nr:uncharacterized protein LOC122308818 isoform X3 [Carya illinoinensis]KAG2706442.1 hypothetical protein I3760_05G104000 [Carya illinoinensis]KAG6653815.1 hypothetical protein CIPAW_05G102200 [Carya illinoinensis]KAG6712373.1 hypothetical protein I3842_05G100000 [Carya illinoinensis]KAG7978657.1 hypothetical protein I3843_05G092900 [Carya illinoinensis]
MVERFFSVRQVELLDHNHSDPIMLLSGPPSCGKTSLLFQFAFNSAAGSNHEVVFICNRRKLESKPPYFSPGIDPSSDTFQRIQMKSCQEKYNNPRGRDLAMVRTLALCHNAIAHANKTGPCKLLLSDTHHGDSPRLLFIYKRWVPAIFTIKGDGLGSFVLKSNSSSVTGSSARMRTAKYSIALQHLTLEGITENSDQ